MPDHLLDARPELLTPEQVTALEGRLIWGRPGVGKSYACAALLREHARHLLPVGWVAAQDLIEGFKHEGTKEITPAAQDALLAPYRFRRLVIDDLGRWLAPWHQDRLASWLDEIRPATDCWVTSNRDPFDLEQLIGSPAMDRLYGRVGGLRAERHLEGTSRRRE